MKNTLFGIFTAGLAVLGFAAAPAQAHDTVKAGMLVCGVEGGAGFVIGSSKELRCVFFDDANREVERYVGDIRKFGLDIGVTEKTEMRWVVFAPSTRLGRGALAGNYIGASADASIGIGAGAKVLVGGSDRTISLQPLSLQGQTGLNVAAGVADLELHPYGGRRALK